MIEHVLFIDSRYATITKSPTEFIVNMNGDHVDPGIVFKKVVSVELTAFSVNTTTGLSQNNDEHYLILDIEELNNRVLSNVPHATGMFAVLYYNPSQNNTQLIKGQDFDMKIRTFDTPLDSLSRLSFSIKAAHSTSSAYSMQNFPADGYFTMIFKVKTLC